MRVAVTVWENRISPLFDATRTLLIADIHGCVVTEKHLVPFDCISPFSTGCNPGRTGGPNPDLRRRIRFLRQAH